MAMSSQESCVVEKIAGRPGLAIAMALAFACVNTAARAAEDPCPVLTALRAMSADHFKKQRGQSLDQDKQDFATAYRIPGAAECKIGIHGDNYSAMSCSWFLQRGLDAEPKARAQFLQSAESYQGCIKDRDGMEVRKHRDGTGGYVDLTDRFVGGRAGSEYAVSITYSWSAPWWYLYVEYRRSDP